MPNRVIKYIICALIVHTILVIALTITVYLIPQRIKSTLNTRQEKSIKAPSSTFDFHDFIIDGDSSTIVVDSMGVLKDIHRKTSDVFTQYTDSVQLPYVTTYPTESIVIITQPTRPLNEGN